MSSALTGSKEMTEDGFEDDNLGEMRAPRSFLRFAVPTIIMMVFTSSYVMADGLVISNTLGTDALAAANLMMPVFSLFSAIGFMFASGGVALVSRKMGEGRKQEANSDFTTISIVAVAAGSVIAVFCLLIMGDLVGFLGADDTLRPMTTDYLTYWLFFSPFLIFQFLFQQFLVAAGRPGLTLLISVTAGIANVGLDILFIVGFGWGIAGAAVASGLSSAFPAAIGLYYFRPGSKSALRYSVPSRNMKSVGKACSNGVSEMISEISGSISTLLLNLYMMSLVGPDGVSAITIALYVQFLAMAVIIGYSVGVAPLMAYNYGRGDRDTMSLLYRTSIQFTLLFSVFVFAFMEVFGGLVVSMFEAGNDNLHEIAVDGIRIHACAYLFMGLNMYVSSFFTSLSNGLLSAVVSALRALVLLIPILVILESEFGLNGLWASIPVTEFITACVAIWFVVRSADRYGYRLFLRRSAVS